MVLELQNFIYPPPLPIPIDSGYPTDLSNLHILNLNISNNY